MPRVPRLVLQPIVMRWDFFGEWGSLPEPVCASVCWLFVLNIFRGHVWCHGRYRHRIHGLSFEYKCFGDMGHVLLQMSCPVVPRTLSPRAGVQLPCVCVYTSHFRRVAVFSRPNDDFRMYRHLAWSIMTTHVLLCVFVAMVRDSVYLLARFSWVSVKVSG